jgi:hypothetical protein
MSNAKPIYSRTDLNLLFGILALQMDFISRDELIQAYGVKPHHKIGILQGA